MPLWLMPLQHASFALSPLSKNNLTTDVATWTTLVVDQATKYCIWPAATSFLDSLQAQWYCLERGIAKWASQQASTGDHTKGWISAFKGSPRCHSLIPYLVNALPRSPDFISLRILYVLLWIPASTLTIKPSMFKYHWSLTYAVKNYYMMNPEGTYRTV